MIRNILATTLALTSLLPMACTSTKSADPAEPLVPNKTDSQDQDSAAALDQASDTVGEAIEVEEVEVDADAVEDDSQDSDDAQSNEPQSEQTEDDGDASAAIELPCDLPIVNKSAAAVAQPCLTTEEFIRSLDLSEEQIRKVENLSKSTRLAH